MKMVLPKILVLLVGLMVSVGAWGQFTTPVINATFDGAGVYPSNVISGTSTWYLTWNETDLFVFLQSANQSEPVSIFLDVDPMLPVNGGTNANGTLVGINYDGYTVPPNLPVRADVLIYAHNGYREIFRRNGSGGWTSLGGGGDGICGGGTSDYAGNANGQYSSNDNGNGNGGDDRREFRISWARLLGAINGGNRPSSFNWFGYVSYNNGMYAQVPTENYNGGAVNLNSNGLTRYYTVSSTANGASTNPFSRNSYTHPFGTDNNLFGAISVWDFTMNSPGRTITRTAGLGQAWTINGSLVVADGILSFGTSTTTATIGSLNQSGGTLALSGSSGGDLYINGNFAKTGGTFNCNDRQIRFTGAVNQQYSSNVTESINFLRNAKTAGSLNLNSSFDVPITGNTLLFDANTTSVIATGVTINLGTGTLMAANNAGSLITVNGTINNLGTVSGTAATVSFSATGIYNHNLIGGAIPLSTWNISSNCNVNGMTVNIPTASSFNQTFGNLTWNCTGQTGIANFTGILTSIAGNLNVLSTGTNVFRLNTNSPATVTLNIGGDFNQLGGIVDLTNGTSTVTINVIGNYTQSGGILNCSNTNSGSGIINVSGNFSQTSGTINVGNGSNGTGILRVAGTFSQSVGATINDGSSSLNHLIEFNGSLSQSINLTGTISNLISFRCNNAAGITITGTLPINENATFFRTQGAITGTISYNQTASTLSYDGVGLTTTDVEWLPTSGPLSVTINTAASANQIALHNPRSISNILTLTNGILVTGNHDLTIINTAVSAISWVGNGNSYVSQTGSGQLIRALLTTNDQTYNYPIGDAGGLANLIYFSVTNNVPNRLVGFRTIDGASPNINTPNTPPDYLNRYWVSTVSPSTGTYSYRFTNMSFQSGEFTGTAANIKISSYLSGVWTDASTTGTNPLVASSNYTQATAPLNTGHFSGRNSSATYTWTGISNNSWATTTNWLPNGFPSPTDNIIVNVPGTFQLTINELREISSATLNGTGIINIASVGNLTTPNFTFGGSAILNMAANGQLHLQNAVTYSGSPTTDLNCGSTVFYEKSSAGDQIIMPLQYGNLFATGGTRAFTSGATTSICGVYTRSATTTTLTGSTVVYNGTALQTIQGGTNHNYSTLRISNSSSLFNLLSGNIRVIDAFIIDNNTWLDSDIRAVDISNSTSVINGTWRRGNGAFSQTTGSLTFGPTGVYEHNLNGGLIPNATWDNTAPGSTCSIIGWLGATGFTGGLTPSGGFSNFTWNSPSQTGTPNLDGNLQLVNRRLTITSTGGASNRINLSNTVTILLTVGEILINGGIFATNNGASFQTITCNGNFTVTSGSFEMNAIGASAAYTFIRGNFSHTGGTIARIGGNQYFEFNGSSGAQNLTITNPLNVTGAVNFRLNNSNGLQVTTGSTFPINGGAVLQVSQGNVTLNGTAAMSYGNSPTLAELLYDPTGSIAITTNGEWPLTGMRRVRINSVSSQPITLNTTREMSDLAGSVIQFSSGRLALGNNNLLILNNEIGAVLASGGYAETNGSGQLLRSILTSAGPHLYYFPVGNGLNYTPALYNFANNSLSGRQLGVRSVGAIHPNMLNAPVPADYLNNRYWVTTLSDASGTYSYTPSFTYISGDIEGTTIGNVKLSRWNSSSWTNTNNSNAAGVTISTTVALTQTTGNLANGQWSGRQVKIPDVYTWNVAASGDWTTAGNWLPALVPGSQDEVVFNHSGNFNITNIPVEINLARISVTGTGTTNFYPGDAGTVSISGGANALQVTANATLVIRSTNASNWVLLSGSNGSIAGTVILRGEGSNTAHTLQASDAGAIVFASGSKFEAGVLNITNYSGFPFGEDATAGSVVFQNGSIIEQFDGSNPFGNTGVISFQTGSLYRYSDNNSNPIVAPSFSNRSYANFEYNSTQNKSVLGTSAFSMDNLVVTQGTFNINMTGTPGHTIRGHISVANGTTLNFNPASAGTIVLGGSSTQNISGAGSLTTNAFSTLSVINNLGVILQKNMTIDGILAVSATGVFNMEGENIVSGTGSLTTVAGSTLGIGSANGITNNPTASGNVRTTTRTYNGGANYVYIGTANQNTGIGLPSAITGRLEVANIGGANNTVSLTTVPTTTANLRLTSGRFATGGATSQLNISTGGIVTGNGGDFVVGANAGILNFSGAGTFSGNSNPFNVHISGGVNFGAGTVTIQNLGRLRINAGGFADINGPFYALGSTLEYNTGASFTAGTEWYALFTSGRGVPHHVQIGQNGVNNSQLAFGTSTNWRYATGNITIGDGSGGSGYGFSLATNSGGDVRLEGNWVRHANGAFTPNNRAVFFIGNTGNQTISRIGGGTETFSYLIVDKSSGNVQLTNSPATDVTVNGSLGGDVLQLVQGNLDINGRLFQLGGAGGNFRVFNAQRQVFSLTPAIFRVIGDKEITSTGGGTLLFNNQTSVEIAAGLNFGPSITTINATLQINTGGFANVNAPIYGPNGVLIYNTSTNYLRRVEWNGIDGGPGFPNDVIVRNNSFLVGGGDVGNSIATNFGARRDVTIEPGSRITMANEFGSGNMTVPLTVGRDLLIQGNLTASTVFGGDIQVGRNWTRTAPGTFTHNNRAVFFNTNQDGAILYNSGAEFFPYLIVNKDNSANHTLTLNAPVNIGTKFTLTSGRVITNTTNLLTITNTAFDDPDNGVAVADLANNPGYVHGPMRRHVLDITGAQRYLFPVGKLEGTTHFYKRFMMRDLDNSVPGDYFTGEYVRAQPPDSGPWLFQTNLLAIPANEFWDVNTISTSIEARLVLPYASGGNWLGEDKMAIPIDANTNVAVVRGDEVSSNNYNWDFTGPNNFTFSNNGASPEARALSSTGDVSSRLITQFSPFTFGVGFNNILPLRLLTFTAALHGPDALLHWQLADAKDLKHFEVEHSTDGQRFSRLATINSNGGNDYHYKHAQLPPGVHYYRLQMVEKDGRRTQSKTEVLMVNTNRTLITGMLQNPVQGGQAIVRVYSAGNQNAEVMMMDMTGRMLMRQMLKLQTGFNQPAVSVMLFPAGMYKLIMRTDDGVEKVMSMMK